MSSLKNFIRDNIPEVWLDWYHMHKLKSDFDNYRYTEIEQNLLRAFDDHKVLFIHIPKTAGISVRDSLFQTHGFGKHVRAITYKYYLGSKTFNTYFKFTFVRNPWARTLSAYHFLKKGGINEIDREWADSVLTKYKDFESFVLQGLESNEVKDWIHFIPQHKWICNHKGRILMDFVGRLENIDEDYEFIRQKTGLGIPLTHKNQGAGISEYQKHYTDAMHDRIAKVYAKDIEMFDYSF